MFAVYFKDLAKKLGVNDNSAINWEQCSKTVNERVSYEQIISFVRITRYGEGEWRRPDNQSGLDNFAGFNATGANLARYDAAVFINLDFLKIGRKRAPADAGGVEADSSLGFGQAVPGNNIAGVKPFSADITCSWHFFAPYIFNSANYDNYPGCYSETLCSSLTRDAFLQSLPVVAVWH